MPKTITISEGQSLLDVALWQLGGVEAVWALADANGLAITDSLRAGQVLSVPEGFTVRAELVDYYAAQRLRINTTNTRRADPPAVDELVDFLDADFDDTDFF
jgi:hypothetical protein